MRQILLLMCAPISEHNVADILKRKCALTILSHLQASEPHFANCKNRICLLHCAVEYVITEEVTGSVNVLKDFKNVDEVNFVNW
jgi:hypothetical protein